jgi:NADH-quinone oxidoreductase subunit M
MTTTLSWLIGLLVPPLMVGLLGTFDLGSSRLRALAVVAASLSLAVGSLVFVLPELGQMRVAWPWGIHPLFGSSMLRVTELSAPLVVLPTAAWLVTVAVTPRARLDSAGVQRTALATSAATLAFLTDSPVLLVSLWVASNVLFLRALFLPDHRGVKRVVGRYLWASVSLLAIGVALQASTTHSVIQSVGLWFMVGAVAIRKGIFPFHAWIPEAFDRGSLGPVVLFNTPQLGAYTAAVLIVPHASHGLLRTVAVLSLVTAVYGASLAIVQRDARRACGYLFVSQSALVLAGLDCTSTEALAGALVLWISSALAFTGMARTILALEVRRGRLDLTKLHGGYEQMKLLAASFLVLGLACTGFPGTLGFVGQEMLIDGAVHDFPVLGFLTIATSALTGVAVLRMYFSLFCGGYRTMPQLGLLGREAIIFGAVAAALVMGGIFPRPILASRIRASEAILQQRRELTIGSTASISSDTVVLGNGMTQDLETLEGAR